MSAEVNSAGRMLIGDNVATPANWHPGDKVIVPAPTTMKEAESKPKEEYECVDWYLCKKDISPKI